jgi:hypothetical protein
MKIMSQESQEFGSYESFGLRYATDGRGNMTIECLASHPLLEFSTQKSAEEARRPYEKSFWCYRCKTWHNAQMDLIDDNAPPEELEMATEEMTGHPFPGKPDERIEAIKKRIAYLENQKSAAEERMDRSFESLAKDLAEARKQLSEWQAQHKGRN